MEGFQTKGVCQSIEGCAPPAYPQVFHQRSTGRTEYSMELMKSMCVYRLFSYSPLRKAAVLGRFLLERK